MRTKILEFCELNPNRRANLSKSQQEISDLFVDQAISGVKLKEVDTITGMTSRDFFYHGDFEKNRINPSGVAYYSKGKSAREASIEYRMPTRLKVIYMGGIKNMSIRDYAQIVDLISDEHGGKVVKCLYNSSMDWMTDLSEVSKGRWLKEMTYPVMLALKSIREDLATEPGCATHLIAHSQGCIHMYNALKHLRKEEIERLRVTFIAPGKPIPRSMCENSINLVRWNDPVYWSNSFPLHMKCNVKLVKGHDSARWYKPDHAVLSESFRRPISKESKKYLDQFNILDELEEQRRKKQLFELTNGKAGIRI